MLPATHLVAAHEPARWFTQSPHDVPLAHSMRYAKKQAINNGNKIMYNLGLKKIVEVNQR